jgi:hypothetical protein
MDAKQKFHLTRSDISRLDVWARNTRTPPWHRPRLGDEIASKLRHVIPIHEPAPAELASVGSVVWLRNLQSGAHAAYTLTDPADVLPVCNGLSILFPLGLAVLGRREGETFLYRGARGPVLVKIEKVSRDRTLNSPLLRSGTALGPAADFKISNARRAGLTSLVHETGSR